MHFGISGITNGGLGLCMKPIFAGLAGLICAFSQMSGCGGSKNSPPVPIASAIARPASGAIAQETASGPIQHDPGAKTILPANGPKPMYSWTNVKIVGGGYITGVYFHPSQQNLMYARTDMGEAYRWGPDGVQWVSAARFHRESELVAKRRGSDRAGPLGSKQALSCGRRIRQ